MILQTRALHPLFAAEAAAVDLLDPAMPSAVEAAVDTHAVLVLRGQWLDDDAQITFSRRFGALELPPSLGIRNAAQVRRVGEGIFDVSNLNADGGIEPRDLPRRQFGKADQVFHTDSSFHALPTKWSLLSARIVPASGGETEFIDLRAVYTALPETLQRRIAPLSAWHSIWHSRARAGSPLPPAEIRDRLPPVLQQIVRIAPDGRPTLFIGAHAGEIAGMNPDEGRALINELNAFAAQPRFVYAHRWRAGDLVIWDNRCTLHRATPFDDLHEKRDMRRTTIMEHGPERSAVAA